MFRATGHTVLPYIHHINKTKTCVNQPLETNHKCTEYCYGNKKSIVNTVITKI